MGEAITTLRERAGMSRADLAEKVDLSPPNLERLESGASDADWATLRDLARELHRPLYSLMELAEELAPGEGGEEWRHWSREAEREGEVD